MKKSEILELQNLLNNMTYDEVARFYNSRLGANNYTINSNEDLIALFNYNIEEIEGYNLLDEQDKAIVNKGICRFVDGNGLAYKHNFLVYKIEKHIVENYGIRYKLYTTNNYYWLYQDLSIG